MTEMDPSGGGAREGEAVLVRGPGDGIHGRLVEGGGGGIDGEKAPG